MSAPEKSLASCERLQSSGAVILFGGFFLSVLSFWLEQRAFVGACLLASIIGFFMMIVGAIFHYRAFVTYWRSQGLSEAGVRDKWQEIYPPGS